MERLRKFASDVMLTRRLNARQAVDVTAASISIARRVRAIPNVENDELAPGIPKKQPRWTRSDAAAQRPWVSDYVRSRWVDTVLSNEAVALINRHAPSKEKKTGETKALPAYVETSTAPDAGEGLFAGRDFGEGELVTLYPGKVYGRREVLRILNEPEGEDFNRVFMQHRSHCTALFDESIVDALDAPSNPSMNVALGHKINHPPLSIKPNVMKVAFRWNAAFCLPDDIPNTFAGFAQAEYWTAADVYDRRGPADRLARNLVHRVFPDRKFGSMSGQAPRDACGVAIIALNKIAKGEEVFINYRFNPKTRAQWPEWYHPVNEAEDALRWPEQ